MTAEFPKEAKTIPSNLPEFLGVVVEEFKNTPSVRNIETIAQGLVKTEGMEHFAPQVGSKEEIRDHLKNFLGEKEWKKITDKEVKRWFEGDRDVVSAAGG